MKFLEIAGSYNRGPEWDIIRDIPIKGKGIIHDMRILPIPGIEDNSYNGAFNEHFIEHLTKEEGIAFFKEMYRVLKPGAVIRTIWPSMDFVDYLQSDNNLEFHPYVDKYYKVMIMNGRVFDHPYYKDVIDVEKTKSMTPQRQVATRLLYQEGEHKHLWYKQELIETLREIGFVDVREHTYFESRFDKFNNIDSKQGLRIYESAIVEATINI